MKSSPAIKAWVQINYIGLPDYGASAQKHYSLSEELSFDQIKHRERTIDDAQDGTCEWIFSTAQYSQWSANPRTEWHHGFLRIKGKPGAGKSTIMKFMVDHARMYNTDELILPHFFNARGTKLEQSTEGMYRTLLVWLLETLPQPAIDELQKLYGTNKVGSSWPVPELVRILKAAVAKLPIDRPAVFYIDALDECDEDEVRAMLQVFRALVKRNWDIGKRISVCFASRPYPDVNFRDSLLLDLGQQQEHLRDIINYIDLELNIGDDAAAKQLRAMLCEKASGSFMWTKLVVRILNKEHDRGLMHGIEMQLKEIPSDLHQLYRYTLHRYQEDRPAMLVCFRWLLFAKDTMADAELWMAIQRGLGRDSEHIRHDCETLPDGTWERYVVGISKGLVEVRFGECYFVHQSVRDFLLKESEVQRLFGFTTVTDFQAQTQDFLKTCCEIELRAFRPTLEQFIRYHDESYISSLYADLFYEQSAAFTSYAAHYMLIHAEDAHDLGLNQTAFFTDLHERIGPHYISTDSLEQGEEAVILHDVLSLLVQGDYGVMIRDTQSGSARRALQSGQPFGLVRSENSRLSPLWYALLRAKRGATVALMDVHLGIEKWHPDLDYMLRVLIEAWEDYGEVGVYVEEGEDQFLELGRDNPSLALFFLLVLTSPPTLEPYIEDLGICVNPEHPRTLNFLLTLLYFIRRRLSSIAVDFTRPETFEWISKYKGSCDAGDEMYGVCEQILEELPAYSVHGASIDTVLLEH